MCVFFFSSRRRHTRCSRDWSSDVCSSDLASTALPPNLEPHMQGLDIWQQRKPLIYENLIWVDESLEAKPELAERWEQRSPTEYVFRLRRGVRFHGGKELDAEDGKDTHDPGRAEKVSPGANDPPLIKQIH